MELRGTTILSVRHKGHVALIGDGQVTMGQSIVMKHNAKKVRRMYKDQIVAGFAGKNILVRLSAFLSEVPMYV